MTILDYATDLIGFQPDLSRLGTLLQDANPDFGPTPEVRDWRAKNWMSVLDQFMKIQDAEQQGIPTFYGSLRLAVTNDDETVDYGLASLKVVTTAGVNYIVQVFLATATYDLNKFKYHGIGTGATAESAADTALVTELTTQYNPNSTRATGTTVQGASANIFRTVATNTVDATAAITEHGIFDQAATGGGTLIDRSVFSVINLGVGDAIQSTYDLTFTAGS